MTHYHPMKDNWGEPVPLHHPHTPSARDTWLTANQHATVVPGSVMPGFVNGIPVSSWADVPNDRAAWDALVLGVQLEEPPYKKQSEMKTASGAVVLEPDGRVWVVSPSNRYAGYTNTFPKGTVSTSEPLSLRANALKEVFEESGLRVRLVDFLCDSQRSQSYTRYYLAHRVGGNPADMGWESQAVHLVPYADLAQFVTHHNDKMILQALSKVWSVT